jgi:hypothetical protein
MMMMPGPSSGMVMIHMSPQQQHQQQHTQQQSPQAGVGGSGHSPVPGPIAVPAVMWIQPVYPPPPPEPPKEEPPPPPPPVTLESVLRFYRKSLRLLFTHFAFKQRKVCPGVLSGAEAVLQREDEGSVPLPPHPPLPFPPDNRSPQTTHSTRTPPRPLT